MIRSSSEGDVRGLPFTVTRSARSRSTIQLNSLTTNNEQSATTGLGDNGWIHGILPIVSGHMDERLLAIEPEDPRTGIITIAGVQTLTDSETAAIAKARSSLNQLVATERLFNIYNENMRIFRGLAQNTLGQFAANQKMSGTRMNRIITMANCYLLNVLTSFRTYLDHSETMLKRALGAHSAEYLQFKAATSHEYDARFAYRFFYRLRNYSQHCGMPISHIQLESHVVSDGPDGAKTAETMQMYLSPKTLLTDFDGWGALLQKDLNSKSRNVNVLSLLKDCERAMLRIHRTQRRIMTAFCRPEARLLRSFMERVRKARPMAVPCVGTISGSRDRSSARFSLQWFPVPEMRALLPNDRYLHLFVDESNGFDTESSK